MSGETEKDVSGWTVDTMHHHVQVQLDAMQDKLQERYATQTKAVDAAFLAQQTAMQTALTAAERATDKALLSAEKAVSKAEVATEKRFEGVNEFRRTVTDIAANNVTRAEASAIQQRNDERIQVLTDALALNRGRDHGVSLTVAALISVATLVISIVVVVINLVTA